MCKSVSSSSVHGTDMSLHRRLDEQTVLVTGVVVVCQCSFQWLKSAVLGYTQACPRTSLFCFLLYQLSLWWVKYRAQPEAINP